MSYSAKEARHVRFHEVQRFRQWWLWGVMLAIVLSALLPIWIGVYQITVKGVDPSQTVFKGSGYWVLIMTAFLVPAAVIFLLGWIRLETVVDAHGLHVSMRPFRWRHIPFSSIANCAARRYHPMREYGGWGIRMGFRGKGQALNVSGDRGVQLTFQTDEPEPLLIGSQRAEDLARVINEFRGTIS